jgi:hypothetical protein
VGRSSVTTREGNGARLLFALTQQGVSALRKHGRLRIAVAVRTTAADGTSASKTRTITIRRPAKPRKS